MDKADIWPAIHAERKALGIDLQGLTGEQWASASLCDQWTVRDVTAHMTATAKITPPAFFAKLAASGFSLSRLQEKDIGVEKGTSPADTLARFEAIVTSSKHPPGRPTPGSARRSSTPRTSAGRSGSHMTTRPAPCFAWRTSSRART